MERGAADGSEGLWGERLRARPRGALARWRASCGDWVEAQAARGRFAPWAPVLLGLGIAIYFTLREEPALLLVAGLLAASLAAAWAARRGGLALGAALGLALVALGVFAAKLATERASAPQLYSQVGPTGVIGTIEHSEWRPHGARFVVRIERIEGLRPHTAPRRVLMTWRGAEALPPVGAHLSAFAILRPVPGPTAPGAYHWKRTLFFRGIGATGFTLGAPDLEPAETSGPVARTRAMLAGLRQAITRRIFSALDGESAAIAAALLTGERGRISEEAQTALRHAGLAHILAISGLHMALFAGWVFLLGRMALAAIPALALHYPTRKWAAGAALASAAFYLAISGASIATQRAFIMIAIMLAAVMLDRRALTMRNVAIAAFVLLLLSPEALLGAGFQMSFAATVALIAAYEAIGGRLVRFGGGDHGGRAGTIASWAARYVGGLAATSLIAGLATAPFALYHFHLVTPYGLAGNLIAMPFVASLVMPMGVLALTAMPFGLEGPFLAVMGFGIESVLAAARWVAGWDGAAVSVPAVPVAALGAVAVSGLWLCLWQGRVRMIGLAGFALAALLARPERPAILVEADGDTLAVRQADGRLAVLGARGARFSVGRWMEADGARGREPADLEDAETAACDALGCIARLPNGDLLAHVRHPAAFDDDCARATIVVSALDAPQGCTGPALVLDRSRLAIGGAHAIVLPENGPPRAQGAFKPGRPWDAPAFWYR